MSGKEDDLLQVFMKNPCPGKVKTRLAGGVGTREAKQIYLQLLTYTRDTVKALPVDIQVWYSDYIPEKDLWDRTGVEKRVQRGEDLGERMKFALEDAFAGGYRRAVLIGSDCAELTPAILERAFDSLRRHDLVLGPSVDGGYYLIGMNRLHRQLFEDKPWSSPELFRATLADIEKSSLNCRLLPELNDVDTISDWEAVKHKFSGDAG